MSTPPICGVRALVHPLVSNSENAFNPCFLTITVTLFAATYAVIGASQLLRYRARPAFGSTSPKSTGLAQWVRCVLVVLHNLCFSRLIWSISIVERLADNKLAAFGLLAAVAWFVVMPLHAIEPSRAPTPSGILLTFWPFMGLIDLTLWYQDSYTAWPVFLFKSAPAFELVALACAIAVIFLESSKRFWKPTHELLTHYSKDSELEPLLHQPNIYERLTFSWMNQLITNSYVNQTVSNEELPEAPENFTCEYYTKRLKRYWDDPNVEKTRSRLFVCIIKAFAPLAFVSFLYEGGDSLLSFVQPQLLRMLIKFIGEKNKDQLVPVLKGLLTCLMMFIVTLIQTSLNNQYVIKVLEVGLGCRTSLTSLVFQKSLRLSMQSRSERSSGDIVNLVSIDAPRVQTCAQEISTLIIAPTELVLCIWSLYSLLGKSAFVGVGVLLFVVPANTALVRYSKRLNKYQMKLKDVRNRVINEILVSMKSIKLYSWEQPMLARLFTARNDRELKNLKKIRAVNQIGNMIWNTMPFLVAFSVFACFALTESTPLTSDIVFPAIALLNILAKPILQLPSIITYITEAAVALERIAEFLLAPEVDADLLQIDAPNADHALKLENISFLWEAPTDVAKVTEDMDFSGFKYALRDVNIAAKQGEFVCIVGKVGSGKSSLLSSILGQLDAVDSTHPSQKPRPITVKGKVAYCSQNPWIMNASFKENITFGHRLDETYYQKTLEACQLIPDIKILPDGDSTQVGEKGISLSGGQKARLSLARAVYARADVYLLDDILSAVDSHVGKNILNKVLSKTTGLLANKTVIFATNSISSLEYSDKIYMFEHGRIIEEGSYTDIVGSSAHPKLNALMSESGLTSAHTSTPDEPETLEETVEVIEEDQDDEEEDLICFDNANKTVPTALTYRKASLATFDWDPFRKNTAKRTGPIAEVSAKGKVKWDVYFDYITACSITGMCVWVLLYVCTTIASISSNYWLKKWAEDSSKIGDNSQALYFIGVFALLGMSNSILSLIQGILFWVYLGIKGGKTVHDRMANRVMKAPMNFFERTPVGRIMNRFSNDVNKVDDALPRSIHMWVGAVLKTTSTIIVVALALPGFLVVVVLLVFIYGYYQKYYVSVQREMKRLVSISRSPIFAHMQESLTGVETIKAYRQENRFDFINNANVDFNMRSLYMLRSINRWLSVRLQFIGSLVIFSSSALLVYKSTTASPISAGMAGFVMSYALQVTDTFRNMVRMSAEVEANLVSVERCVEYWHLPTEEDEDALFIEPSADWPGEGRVQLNNYSTRYAKNLDLVLKHINLSINSGEKVGVVGRTGAGKSSLVLAIFRMIPPVEGTIEIDSIPTEKLRLFDLRHNLSIIPQDAHLFEGSVRDNLDPFGEHQEAQLWKVLEHSNLRPVIEQLGDGLDSKVSEGGSNFSVGQRQLMCLARALLNPSKVLMLDEATAAVDIQTDKIIQTTIRREFKDRTIITIAHRLDTVMDSDRILALDHGEVREFDSPANLMRNPDSIFYNLCKQGNYLLPQSKDTQA